MYPRKGRRTLKESEGISHREVEIGVAAPARVDDGPGLLIGSGVVGFHAQVETQQEVGEVHAQAGSVGRGDLLVEPVETKHAAGLRGVVADGPDVACIHEEGAFKQSL